MIVTSQVWKMDDVFQIADWKKVSDLGSGAFGVVSLWRNIITNDYIGQIISNILIYPWTGIQKLPKCNTIYEQLNLLWPNWIVLWGLSKNKVENWSL